MVKGVFVGGLRGRPPCPRVSYSITDGRKCDRCRPANWIRCVRSTRAGGSGWDGVMKVARQTTLRDHAVMCGVGIHSGLPVTLTLHPADADTGVRFVRTRLEGWQDREI